MGPGRALKFPRILLLLLICTGLVPTRAQALERFCDSAYQDCRTPLLQLIANERIGIDIGFWFMEDSRYVNALINRFKAGVRVRVLVDQRASASDPLNATTLSQLAAAGIPMRQKTTGGILHWKAAIFDGQGTVEYGSANYSGYAFVPITPYVNYIDETIRFTEQRSIVQSFMRQFDDLWISTSGYANFANVHTTPVRQYPVFTKDPSLNFPPSEDFGARSVARYNAETTRIDVMMYRITDRRHTDAIIAAVKRGIPVRLMTEQQEYRDPKYLWDSWNVDRLYMAGVQIRQRKHAGLNHGKLVLLYGQGMAIFGSSNWTLSSATSQAEHNHFLVDATAFSTLTQQFSRRWNNSTGNLETAPFTPQAPQTPVNVAPQSATHQPTSVRISWKPGYWAHKADIYFGTSPSPPLLAHDVAVTPNTTATYTLPPLAAGKTYYWRIVNKTMANKTAAGPVWNFGT